MTSGLDARAGGPLPTPVIRGREDPGPPTVDDVRAALRNGELELWFQPKVEIAGGGVVGAEGLLRWQVGGEVVAPERILAAAEAGGLMPEITHHVVEQAVDRCARWLAAGVRMPVAVNVTPADLADPRLPDQVRSLLDAYRLPGELLLLEVTENAVLQDLAGTVAGVERLRRIGVRISVDDFGVGYSSLSRLVQLQLGELKVDQSLIMAMRTSGQAATAVRAVIDLGHALGLRVVAEGVENERLLIELRGLGCDVAQGYLFAPALTAEDFCRWVRERRAPVPSSRRQADAGDAGSMRRLGRRIRSAETSGRWTGAAIAAPVALYLGWLVLHWGGPAHKLLVGDLASLPANVAAAVAAAWAARVHRQDRGTHRAWLWLGTALAAYVAGDLIQTWYEVIRREELPFPSAADLGYLTFYPAALVALMSFPTARRSRPERLTVGLDIGIVALGGAAIIWVTDLAPTAAAGGPDLVTMLTSLAYPVGDLVLMFGAVSLLLRARAPGAGRPVRLLLLGFAIYLATDIVYSHLQLIGAYSGGDPVDGGWILAHVAILLAALAHVRQRSTPLPEPDPRRLNTLISGLPYLAVAVCYLLLIGASLHARWNPLVVGLVLAAGALTGLVTLRQWASLRENSRLLAKYQELAVTDALTGLLNRRRVLELAEDVFDHAVRDGQPLSVLMMDVDHFKQINDRFGHQAGDQILCAVAETCKNQLRPQDLVGRYGGDELLAVLPHTTTDLAAAVATRLQERLQDLFTQNLGPAATTLSIGVAELGDTRSLDALLARADLALYTAKDAGRDCTRTYADI